VRSLVVANPNYSAIAGNQRGNKLDIYWRNSPIIAK
jgi:hypothetical protein